MAASQVRKQKLKSYKSEPTFHFASIEIINKRLAKFDRTYLNILDSDQSNSCAHLVNDTLYVVDICQKCFRLKRKVFDDNKISCVNLEAGTIHLRNPIQIETYLSNILNIRCLNSYKRHMFLRDLFLSKIADMSPRENNLRAVTSMSKNRQGF